MRTEERKDVGAAVEDRSGAQHYGHDHQLDVADAPITRGPQRHGAERSAERLPSPKHRSKCASLFPFS